MSIWTDNGVPPDIGGSLAPSGLFGANEARGHIRDTIHNIVIERIVLGVFGVPEDVVMLGTPPALGSGPVVVGPDDFVDEGSSAKDTVNHYLAVMDFAVIKVEEQGTLRFQNSVGLTETRLEKTQKIIEGVIVSPRALCHAGSVFRVKSGALLCPSCIERRVDVNQVHTFGRKGAENIQIVAKMDFNSRW